MPAGHPLAQLERIDAGAPRRRAAGLLPPFVHRPLAHRRLRARGSSPSFVLEAIDADVIKTYVRLGLGVGIVAEMAVRDDAAGGELCRGRRPPVRPNVARIAFKRGAYLRNFVYAFADCCPAAGAADRQALAPGGATDDYHL